MIDIDHQVLIWKLCIFFTFFICIKNCFKETDLTLLPMLECSGTVIAYCHAKFLGSSNIPTSASQVAGTSSVCCHAWLENFLKFLLPSLLDVFVVYTPLSLVYYSLCTSVESSKTVNFIHTRTHTFFKLWFEHYEMSKKSYWIVFSTYWLN